MKIPDLFLNLLQNIIQFHTVPFIAEHIPLVKQCTQACFQLPGFRDYLLQSAFPTHQERLYHISISQFSCMTGPPAETRAVIPSIKNDILAGHA